jgi:hypothetical protein
MLTPLARREQATQVDLAWREAIFYKLFVAHACALARRLIYLYLFHCSCAAIATRSSNNHVSQADFGCALRASDQEREHAFCSIYDGSAVTDMAGQGFGVPHHERKPDAGWEPAGCGRSEADSRGGGNRSESR